MDPTVANSIRRTFKLFKVIVPLAIVLIVLSVVLPDQLYKVRNRAEDQDRKLQRQLTLAQLEVQKINLPVPPQPPKEAKVEPKVNPPPPQPPAPKPAPANNPPLAGGGQAPMTRSGNSGGLSAAPALRPIVVVTTLEQPQSPPATPPQTPPAIPAPPQPTASNSVPPSLVIPLPQPATNQVSTNAAVTNKVVTPTNGQTNQNSTAKKGTNTPPANVKPPTKQEPNQVPFAANQTLPPPRDGTIRISFP